MRKALLFFGLLCSAATAQVVPGVYAPAHPVVTYPVAVVQPTVYVAPPGPGGFVYSVQPVRPVVVQHVVSPGYACPAPPAPRIRR